MKKFQSPEVRSPRLAVDAEGRLKERLPAVPVMEKSEPFVEVAKVSAPVEVVAPKPSPMLVSVPAPVPRHGPLLTVTQPAARLIPFAKVEVAAPCTARLPVVVAPPEMVRPPAWVPLPMVVEA